jgi:excisionase family DNA binding protein
LTHVHHEYVADATLAVGRHERRWKESMTPDRFLTLGDVADVLNISASQTYALVRSGSLPAIKIGGRGQWRVEREQLEAYIERMYDETRRFVEAHPLGRDEPLPPD